jgi:hypothetical protein
MTYNDHAASNLWPIAMHPRAATALAGWCGLASDQRDPFLRHIGPDSTSAAHDLPNRAGHDLPNGRRRDRESRSAAGLWFNCC